MAKAIKVLDIDIYLVHVHSHNGMWVNELVDGIINKVSAGCKYLGIGPAALPRVPRLHQQTKAEVKAIYYKDEDLFWYFLTRFHNSTTGHIRHTLGTRRPIIKEAHKALAFEKRAQTAMNKLLSGNLFKPLIDGRTPHQGCPVCLVEELSWPHFFSCFKLNEIAAEEWRNPEVLAALARSIATFPLIAIDHRRG